MTEHEHDLHLRITAHSEVGPEVAKTKAELAALREEERKRQAAATAGEKEIAASREKTTKATREHTAAARQDTEAARQRNKITSELVQNLWREVQQETAAAAAARRERDPYTFGPLTRAKGFVERPLPGTGPAGRRASTATPASTGAAPRQELTGQQQLFANFVEQTSLFDVAELRRRSEQVLRQRQALRQEIERHDREVQPTPGRRRLPEQLDLLAHLTRPRDPYTFGHPESFFEPGLPGTGRALARRPPVIGEPLARQVGQEIPGQHSLFHDIEQAQAWFAAAREQRAAATQLREASGHLAERSAGKGFVERTLPLGLPPVRRRRGTEVTEPATEAREEVAGQQSLYHLLLGLRDTARRFDEPTRYEGRVPPRLRASGPLNLPESLDREARIRSYDYLTPPATRAVTRGLHPWAPRGEEEPWHSGGLADSLLRQAKLLEQSMRTSSATAREIENRAHMLERFRLGPTDVEHPALRASFQRATAALGEVPQHGPTAPLGGILADPHFVERFAQQALAALERPNLRRPLTDFHVTQPRSTRESTLAEPAFPVAGLLSQFGSNWQRRLAELRRLADEVKPTAGLVPSSPPAVEQRIAARAARRAAGAQFAAFSTPPPDLPVAADRLAASERHVEQAAHAATNALSRQRDIAGAKTGAMHGLADAEHRAAQGGHEVAQAAEMASTGLAKANQQGRDADRMWSRLGEVWHAAFGRAPRSPGAGQMRPGRRTFLDRRLHALGTPSVLGAHDPLLLAEAAPRSTGTGPMADIFRHMGQLRAEITHQQQLLERSRQSSDVLNRQLDTGNRLVNRLLRPEDLTRPTRLDLPGNRLQIARIAAAGQRAPTLGATSPLGGAFGDARFMMAAHGQAIAAERAAMIDPLSFARLQSGLASLGPTPLGGAHSLLGGASPISPNLGAGIIGELRRRAAEREQALDATYPMRGRARDFMAADTRYRTDIGGDSPRIQQLMRGFARLRQGVSDTYESLPRPFRAVAAALPFLNRPRQLDDRLVDRRLASPAAGAVGDLKNAAADARKLADNLKDVGFQGRTLNQIFTGLGITFSRAFKDAGAYAKAAAVGVGREFKDLDKTVHSDFSRVGQTFRNTMRDMTVGPMGRPVRTPRAIVSDVGGNVGRAFRDIVKAAPEAEAAVRRFGREAQYAVLGASRAVTNWVKELPGAEGRIMRTGRAMKSAFTEITVGETGKSAVGGLFTAMASRGDAMSESIARIFPRLISLRGAVFVAVAALGPLVALFGALGGAAMGAGGIMVSLAGSVMALPGLFTAVATSVGVFILALQPLSKVIQTYNAYLDATRQGSAALAESQRQSAVQLRTAQHAVEQASNAVTDANFSEARATISLNEARRQAVRTLQDLHTELSRASLNEEKAILAVKQAEVQWRRTLADSNSTQLDREAAVLRVKDAENDLADVRTKNRRIAEDTAIADRKGVEGSDQVVDANHAVRQAVIAASNAAFQASEAQKQLTQARKEDLAGGQAAYTAANNLKDVLAKLGPVTRQFATELLGLGKGGSSVASEFLAFRNRVSDAFFNPLLSKVGALKDLLSKGGGLSTLLQTTADALGRVIAKGVDMLSSGPWQRDFKTIAKDNAVLVTNFGDAAGYLATAFKDITIAAAPFTTWVSEAVRNVAKEFADWAAEARSSGSIATFLTDTQRRLQIVGDVVSNIWSWLSSVYTALSTVGTPAQQSFIDWMLTSLRDITAGWRDWGKAQETTGSSLHAWLNEIREPLSAVSRFIAAVADAWDAMAGDPRNLDESRRILDAFASDVLPALHEIFGQLSASHVISDLIKDIGRLLQALGQFLAAGGALPLTTIVDAFASIATWWLNVTANSATVGVLNTIIRSFAYLAAASAIYKFTGIKFIVDQLFRLSKIKFVWGILDKIFGKVPVIGGLFNKGGEALGKAGTETVAGTVRTAGGVTGVYSAQLDVIIGLLERIAAETALTGGFSARGGGAIAATRGGGGAGAVPTILPTRGGVGAIREPVVPVGEQTSGGLFLPPPRNVRAVSDEVNRLNRSVEDTAKDAERAGKSTGRLTESVATTGEKAAVAEKSAGALGRSVAGVGTVAEEATMSLGTAGLLGTLGSVGIAILGVVIAGQLLGSIFGHDINPDIDALSDSLSKFGDTGKTSGEAASLLGKDMSTLGADLTWVRDGDLNNGFVSTIEGISGIGKIADTSLEHAKETFKATDQALTGLVKDGHAEDAARAFGRIADEAAKQGVSVDQLMKIFPGYVDSLQNVAFKSIDAKEAEDKRTQQLLDSGLPATDRMKSALDVLGDSTKTAAEHASALGDAWDEIYGPKLKEYTDQLDFNAGLLDLKDTTKQNVKENGRLGTTLDKNTKKGIANQKMILDLLDASKRLYVQQSAIPGQEDKAREAYKKRNQELYNQLTGLHYSNSELKTLFGLAGDISKLPKVAPSVEVTGLANAVAQSEQLKQNLLALSQMRIDAATGQIVANQKTPVRQRAGGDNKTWAGFNSNLKLGWDAITSSSKPYSFWRSPTKKDWSDPNAMPAWFNLIPPDWMATGGVVGGAADGRVDSKPLMATIGEFMVQKPVVDKPYGKEILNLLNEERLDPADLYAGLSMALHPTRLPVNAPLRSNVQSTTINNDNTRNAGLNTGDITINNPVRERSDRSMRRTLQSMAYLTYR